MDFAWAQAPWGSDVVGIGSPIRLALPRRCYLPPVLMVGFCKGAGLGPTFLHRVLLALAGTSCLHVNNCRGHQLS